MAGSTSGALVSACNEFIDYAELSGVMPLPKKSEPAKKDSAKKAAPTSATTKKVTAKKAGAKKTTAKQEVTAESPAQAEATALLVRAVRVGLQKSEEEWVHASGVKSQMQRTNAAFNEKSLGFSTFRAFEESRGSVVESEVDSIGQLMVRLM